MELDRKLLYSRKWGRHMRSWPRRLLGIENLKKNIIFYDENKHGKINNLQYYLVQTILEASILNIEIKSNFIKGSYKNSSNSYLEKILDKYQ